MSSKNMERIWNVVPSDVALNTFNPIRNIVENLDISDPNPDKTMINLSIGDPTIHNSFQPNSHVVEAVEEALKSRKFNGYAPSAGYVEAREAIANHVNPSLRRSSGSVTCEDFLIKSSDVLICSGCSCALDLCITALAAPKRSISRPNILIPVPGFPLYSTLANGLGIETRGYRLNAQHNWMVDIKHLRTLIDENTQAIVVNNPSNPCGSVYSEDHLKEILDVAEQFCIPIIADEIYAHFVFTECEFIPIASLSRTVPVLSCGGLTKRYLVPGWRLGWITIHDRNNVFGHPIRGALQSLSQRIIGANTIVQGALPVILSDKVPTLFFTTTIEKVETNAKIAYGFLKKVPSLEPILPEGAMYMMIGIHPKLLSKHLNSEIKIVESLVREQSVFCLPGSCFTSHTSNKVSMSLLYIRIVLTLPRDKLIESCTRIDQFFRHHSRNCGRSITEHYDLNKQTSNHENDANINNTKLVGFSSKLHFCVSTTSSIPPHQQPLHVTTYSSTS